MSFSYWEAINMTVTSVEARAEIEKHEASWADFVAQFGEHDEYEGSDVLDFLEY